MSAEIEILREAYEALNSGEWERSPEFMHEEITWNFVEGAAPDAPQTLTGASEIVDFWAMVFNPSAMHRLGHVILGAFILGEFEVFVPENVERGDAET